MSENDSTYKNSNHSTEIEILGCNVAQYTEEIGNNNLYNLAIYQESELSKHERAYNS
jgi:hypothetical protein